MPECHANWDWRSRKETLGEVEASSRAMAMAREAGPNPMQIRSSTEVCGDAFIGLELFPASALDFWVAFKVRESASVEFFEYLHLVMVAPCELAPDFLCI